MVTIPTATSLMPCSSLLLYLFSFPVATLHSITISDAFVTKKISPQAAKLGTKVQSCLWCLLCSTEGQTPLLVWSAADGSRGLACHFHINIHSRSNHLFFFLVLVLVGGSGTREESEKYVFAIVLGFLVFCGLSFWNVVIQIPCRLRKSKVEGELVSLDQEVQQVSDSEPLLNKTIIKIYLLYTTFIE